MSTHPNAILMVVLTPDGLSRKTMREIRISAGIQDSDVDRDIKIGSAEYHTLLMEDEYNEGYQLSGKEGDIILFDFLTYGYGDSIGWDRVESQKAELEAWAEAVCEKHHCTYAIRISANYW
jgi:hypothetical protein